MATGTGQEPQLAERTATATDGQFEVAHAPLEEPDFSQAFPSLKERWANFDQDIKKFWDSTRTSRQSGTEVLSFPPPEPDVSRPKEPTKPLDPTKPKLPLLSINQMVERFPDLKSLVFGNTTTYPDLKVDIPNSDRDFRAQYVKSIQEMSRNHGLTDKQVQDAIIKLYAFETGGDGGFDLVSGMTKKSASGIWNAITGFFSDEIPKSDHNFIPTDSTAIGYKQLIMATTMSNVFTDGKNMSAQLQSRANETSDPIEKARLLAKADLIGKLPDTMMQYARESHLKDNPKLLEDPEFKKDPEKYWGKIAPWTLFNSLSRSANPITLPNGKTMTGREFASSIQGLNVDIDLGPLIQATQFRSLIQDWHPDTAKGPKDNVSNNLKASLDTFITHVQDQIKQFDASPVDAKLKALNSIMEQAFKDKPASGIEAVMKDAVTRKLTDTFKNGTEPNFNERERKFLFDNLLLNKVFLNPSMDGKSLADTPEAQDVSRLFYKLNSLYYGGLDAEKLTPAVFELANLLGAPQTRRMLDPAHTDWRTVNFTDQNGYKANQIAANRSAAELLFAIHRVQHGPKADESKLGIKAFRELFAQ